MNLQVGDDMEYRKRPVEVEAFIFYKEPIPDWFMDKVTSNDVVLVDCNYDLDCLDPHCLIRTLEGTMRGNPGDYIVEGVQGEIYPCKPDIFESTYEKVGE